MKSRSCVGCVYVIECDGNVADADMCVNFKARDGRKKEPVKEPECTVKRVDFRKFLKE